MRLKQADASRFGIADSKNQESAFRACSRQIRLKFSPQTADNSAWDCVASRPRLGPPYKLSAELRGKMNENQSACPFGIAMVDHFLAAQLFWFYFIGG